MTTVTFFSSAVWALAQDGTLGFIDDTFIFIRTRVSANKGYANGMISKVAEELVRSISQFVVIIRIQRD